MLQKSIGISIIVAVGMVALAKADQGEPSPVKTQISAEKRADYPVPPQIQDMVLAGKYQEASDTLDGLMAAHSVNGDIASDYFALRMAKLTVWTVAGNDELVKNDFLEWISVTKSDEVADQFVRWAHARKRYGDVTEVLEIHRQIAKPEHRSLARLLVADIEIKVRNKNWNGLQSSIEVASRHIRSSKSDVSKSVLQGLSGFIHGGSETGSRRLDFARLVYEGLGNDNVDGGFLLTLAVLEEINSNLNKARKALDAAESRIPDDDLGNRAIWLWTSAKVYHRLGRYHAALANLQELEEMFVPTDGVRVVDFRKQSGLLKSRMDREFRSKYGIPLIEETASLDEDIETVTAR